MFTGMELLQDRKVAEITQLLVSKNPIIITSNYKGITLTQPVQVISSVPGRVIVQAPDLPLCFTLKLNERIQLYSRGFMEIVFGRLLAINMVMGKLELADLSFSGRHWYEHQSDRVRPRDPIYVHWEHKKTPIQASLDNLSVGGMSLVIYKDREKSAPFDQDTAMHVTLQLPGDDTRLDLKGKVVHRRQSGRLDIFGMQLIGSSAHEKHLIRYVIARKAEIMAELEQASREFLDNRCHTCIIQNLRF